MKSYTPSEMETPQLHGLLLSAVAPRPIAFVSTIDEQGRPNLAPFSFFNVFSANPPIAIFSPARRVRGNTTKHTLDNVEMNKECVINIVNYDILHQMNLASCEFGDGINEFEKAGLTGIASDSVAPLRVKEAPVQLECKVREIIHLGEEGGAGNLVVSEVVRMHFSEDVFGEDGNLDPQKLDLVSRMGQNWYCRANGDAVFEVPKPGRIVGVGVDSMPESIRTSSILTGNDLGQLGMAPALPTNEEIEAFASNLGQTLDADSAHHKAHNLLQEGNVPDAWKTLLTLESN
ncbi:MAG: flavin reductase (DIM6/NTAB) family NADH-FMN oxidoreductase RutF [Bacteroidia bacterium]|jgi:flavin reductase (DIM6/NTAB) family NADH-FMN oxidoreductase RutF